MTLKKKILIGYGVVFAFMGLVVTWAIINLVSLGKATDAILSENYRSIIAAENMVDALERQDSGILILSERIVRPIRNFMEASRKISSGDYAVRVPVETGDELGSLAGEFN